MHAFQRALDQVVRPGLVVLDLGAGTGALGLLACKAGARRVYAVESTRSIYLAEAICRANGFAQRVTFIRGLSTEISLPEPADVVVADQMGGFGFEGGIFDYFRDARARLLAPGGHLIPSAIQFGVVPVEAFEVRADVAFWEGRSFGLDLSPARTIAINSPHPISIEAGHLLGGGVLSEWVDSGTDSTSICIAGACVVARSGTLHGLGGFFNARLAHGVTMGNSPLMRERIRRPNMFLPVDQPVTVGPGDRILANVQIHPTHDLIVWSLQVHHQGGQVTTFRQSSFDGLLLNRHELNRTRPTFTPALNLRGMARATVLSLCEDGRTVQDIERTVFSRHSQLFRTMEHAARFVARVLASDTR